ncbi:hypothetical protein LCGC14_1841200, partial [marine sediment metagenome]
MATIYYRGDRGDRWAVLSPHLNKPVEMM